MKDKKSYYTTTEILKEMDISANFFRSLRPELVDPPFEKVRSLKGFEYRYLPIVIPQIEEVKRKIAEGIGVTEQKKQKLLEKFEKELEEKKQSAFQFVVPATKLPSLDRDKAIKVYNFLLKLVRELEKQLTAEEVNQLKEYDEFEQESLENYVDPDDYVINEYLKGLDPSLRKIIGDSKASSEEIKKDNNGESAT